MRIRKRLQLNVTVSVTTAIVICLMLFLALQRITTVSSLTKTAGDLMSGILERVVLHNDYMRNGNARAKEQWFAKHAQIGRLLKEASAEFRGAGDRENIADMFEVHQAIGRVFATIVANRERTVLAADRAGLSREVEDRLLNQLNMRVYEVTVQIHRLLESARNARSSVLRQTAWEIASLLVFLIGAALLNSWTLGRGITDRARLLREGAELIGGGDLNHRIDVRGDDEFAELSREFNAMAAKLGGSYRALENEIEERGKAEDQVRELMVSVRQERDKLLTLINSLPDEVWFSDARKRLQLVNAAVIRLFGNGLTDVREVEAIAGNSEVYRPDGTPRPIEEAPPLRALAGEIVQNQEEIVRIPATGQLRHRQVNASPVRDANGEIIGSVAVVQDITERKEAEQALEKARDDLARLVEERTRELHEKEVLLKEVHHRVKNNLQVISSLVSLQAEASSDGTVREVLRDVTYRVRSMALVHEKLYQSADLSRIDFAEYCSSLLGYLWRAHGLAAASIRLTLRLTPVPLPVDLAVPCGLILNELAGNALKHAFIGMDGGEVTVSLDDGPDGRVRLVVSDNGVGLPQGFDPASAKSLGLRLVHMLAGQLGAEVKVKSGEGTGFEVVFVRQV